MTSFNKEKIINETLCIDSIKRLKVLATGSVYSYIGNASRLSRKIQNPEEQWLLFKKAYFSFDSSMNLIEKYKKNKLFKIALSKSWNVKNEKDLINQIQYIIKGENSSYANIQIKIYLELKNNVISEHTILETETFQKYYPECTVEEMEHLIEALKIIDEHNHLVTPNFVLGFDLARIVHLVKMGYCLNYFTETQALLLIDLLYTHVEKIENHYSFFASYELGFILFDHDRNIDGQESFKTRLNMLSILLLENENSPFKYDFWGKQNEEPQEILKKIYNIDRIEKKKSLKDSL